MGKSFLMTNTLAYYAGAIMTKTVYGGVHLEGQKVLLTANALAYHARTVMVKTVDVGSS
jgi:hypothetical protein